MTFWDACGQISEPNDAFLELIGYTRADLRLHPVRWQDITPLEYLDAAARAAAELHAGGRCAPFEMEYLTKAGRRVPILVGAALLEGDEKGAVSFALDLTERRRGGARMSQAECVMDEYLATSAHELRNALGPLANALDVARRDLPESRARALAMASRQVTVLSRLVDDLLDVSRAGHGMTILCKEPMDLRSTIEQVAESCRLEPAARDLSVDLSLAEQPLPVEADPARLEQVLTNLVGNAIKYTGPGGHISLSACREGDEIVVRIQDTGIGMAPEVLPRVFDLFVQGQRGDAKGGLGIGLTLVRRLVELHGGTVEARSEGIGRGSEFVVRLPARPTAPTVTFPSRPPRDGSRVHPLRVLVVDDNEDITASLKCLLEVAGHQVTVARDGFAGLDAARACAPEVVLLDLRLPGMDGYEVARRLRGQLGLAHAFLVAMSGQGGAEDRQRVRAAGFDLQLVKPLEPESLLGLLRDWRPAS